MLEALYLLYFGGMASGIVLGVLVTYYVVRG